MSKHAAQSIRSADDSTPDEADGYQFAKLTIEEEQKLATFRQGDVLRDVLCIPLVAADGTLGSYPTPDGVVIVMQTCDVVVASPARTTIQVAPIVGLPEPAATDARRGKRPQYVHIPELGDSYFADMKVVATLEKGYVVRREASRGVEKDKEVRRFGKATGRRYSRFPFPDEVTPWLAPLEEVIVSRHDDDEKPESWALQQVSEFRISADNGWSGPHYDLKLLVVVEPGTIPFFAEDVLPDRPEDLEVWLYDALGNLRRQSPEIAEALKKESVPERRYWLWIALVDAWAARCRPKGHHRKDVKVMAAVTTMEGELWSADEFPLTMVHDSEILDVDHLSVPRPF